MVAKRTVTSSEHGGLSKGTVQSLDSVSSPRHGVGTGGNVGLPKLSGLSNFGKKLYGRDVLVAKAPEAGSETLFRHGLKLTRDGEYKKLSLAGQLRTAFFHEDKKVIPGFFDPILAGVERSGGEKCTYNPEGGEEEDLLGILDVASSVSRAQDSHSPSSFLAQALERPSSRQPPLAALGSGQSHQSSRQSAPDSRPSSRQPPVGSGHGSQATFVGIRSGGSVGSRCQPGPGGQQSSRVSQATMADSSHDAEDMRIYDNQLRAAELQASFKYTVEEIESRLLRLEERAVLRERAMNSSKTNLGRRKSGGEKGDSAPGLSQIAENQSNATSYGKESFVTSVATSRTSRNSAMVGGLSLSGIFDSSRSTPEPSQVASEQGSVVGDTMLDTIRLPSRQDSDGMELDVRTAAPTMTFSGLSLCFTKSRIGVLPLTELSAPGASKDETGMINTSASKEEIAITVEVLNFHRWLCGLSPVQADSGCMTGAGVLSKVLTQRLPCFLKPSSHVFQAINDCGNYLSELIAANPDHGVGVLHNEVSLIEGISQCIMAIHAQGVLAPPFNPPAPADTTRQDEVIASSIIERAAEFRQVDPSELMKKPDKEVVDLSFVNNSGTARKNAANSSRANSKMVAGTSSFSFAVRAPSKRKAATLSGRALYRDHLPAQLKGVQFFWTFDDGSAHCPLAAFLRTDRGLGGAISPSSAFSSRLFSSPSPDQRHMDAGPGRIRKIPWNAAAQQLKMSRDCQLHWGDKEGVVSFRRALLNPMATKFGAARIHDTCVVWTDVEQKSCIFQEDQIGKPRACRKQTSMDYDAEWKKACDAGLDESAGLADRSVTWSGPTTQQSAEQATLQRATTGVSPDSARREFVTFPPPGFFPYELLPQCNRIPTWTIMPDSRIHQPTQALKVRMWYVHINLATCTAFRINEVEILALSCDCSAKGNPFCIMFRPGLRQITAGDQFEVELSGLRGNVDHYRFFHDFRSLRHGLNDDGFIRNVEQFRDLVNEQDQWQKPQAVAQGGRQFADIPEFANVRSSAKRRTLRSVQAVQAQGPDVEGDDIDMRMQSQKSSRDSLPDIGLVSHPNLKFDADVTEHLISLHCPGAAAIKAQLWVHRSGGKDEVRRATLVLKFGEYFLVRVKLPMSPCVFVLTFRVAVPDKPNILWEHPLSYNINAVDNCRSVMTSVEHPFMEKWGFTFQPHVAQLNGVTVVAPMDYRIQAGPMYFLIHFDPGSARYPFNDGGEYRAPTTTRLFSHRLKPQQAPEVSVSESKQSTEGRSPRSKTDSRRARLKGSSAKAGSKKGSQSTFDMNKLLSGDGVKDEVSSLGHVHKNLSSRISSLVQDSADEVYIDISVLHMTSGSQRFSLRLRQRRDFKNLYDGTITFTDQDVGGKVEMFLRLPNVKVGEYAPLKISEWLVIKREDTFPEGF